MDHAAARAAQLQREAPASLASGIVPASPESISFGPDGRALLVAGTRLTGNVWSGELLIYAECPDGSLGSAKKAAAIAHPAVGQAAAGWIDQRTIASAGEDGALSIWAWRGDGTLDCTVRHAGHHAPCRALGLHPDRSAARAVTASDDGSLRLWDLRESGAGCVGILKGHRFEVRSAAWQPGEDSETVGSVGADGTVRIWDVRSAKQSAPLVRPEMKPTVLAWSPAAGREIALGHIDGGVSCYDIRNLSEPLVASDPADSAGRITSLSFSDDGAILGVGSVRGHVRAYEVGAVDAMSSGVVLSAYSNGSSHAEMAVSSVVWHPGLRGTLVSAGWDRSVRSHAAAPNA